jgi:hypothetical protein
MGIAKDYTNRQTYILQEKYRYSNDEKGDKTMSELLKDIKTLVIALATVFVSVVIGVTYYNVNDRILMSRNIDSAIAKGLDPISVRCSFVTNTDTVCVAYAASNKK